MVGVHRLGEVIALYDVAAHALHQVVLGLVLDAPADRRLLGDAAVTAIAIANGADMIRVHDVKEMVQTAKMADAIVRGTY